MSDMRVVLANEEEVNLGRSFNDATDAVAQAFCKVNTLVEIVTDVNPSYKVDSFDLAKSIEAATTADGFSLVAREHPAINDAVRQTTAKGVPVIFDGPVNLLDTSRDYGFGRSEARVGAAIRERGSQPPRFVLSTKLDRDMDADCFDAARARRSFEESLAALGVDHVEILPLHDPRHTLDRDDVTRKGGALDEVFRIKEERLATAGGRAMGQLDSMLPLVKD